MSKSSRHSEAEKEELTIDELKQLAYQTVVANDAKDKELQLLRKQVIELGEQSAKMQEALRKDEKKIPKKKEGQDKTEKKRNHSNTKDQKENKKQNQKEENEDIKMDGNKQEEGYEAGDEGSVMKRRRAGTRQGERDAVYWKGQYVALKRKLAAESSQEEGTEEHGKKGKDQGYYAHRGHGYYQGNGRQVRQGNRGRGNYWNQTNRGQRNQGNQGNYGHGNRWNSRNRGQLKDENAKRTVINFYGYGA